MRNKLATRSTSSQSAYSISGGMSDLFAATPFFPTCTAAKGCTHEAANKKSFLCESQLTYLNSCSRERAASARDELVLVWCSSLG